MKPKIQQTKLSSSIIFAISGAIVFVLAGLAYWILRPSDLTQLLDQPIPYVPDEKLMSKLRQYTEEQKHQDILLVYGPNGIGKTRGILEFSKKYRKEGNLVIDLDLVTYSNHATAHDLIDHICTAILHAFRELDGTPYKANILKDVLDRVAATTSFIATNKIGKHYFIGLIRDPLLQKAASYLISAVESTSTNPNIKAITLYEALETLNEALHTLIVVHEPYKLYQNQGCKEYCVETTQFFGKIFGSASHEFTTGVIFDLADQNKLPLFAKPGFQYVRVFEFSMETGATQLNEVFGAPQYKSIYQSFGGVGVYFARTNELLLSGYNLIESQKLLLDDVKFKVQKVINTAADQKAMRDCLADLVSKAPTTPKPADELREPLIAEGLFFYTNEKLDQIQPSSSVVVTAIMDIVKPAPIKKSDSKKPAPKKK